MKKRFFTIMLLVAMTIQAMAQQEVVFDFSKNPWGVPTTTKGDAIDDKEAGKLDDNVKMITGSVTMTQKKNSDKYWNRIIDNVYTAYKENDFTFTAKEDKVITRIELDRKSVV